MAVRDIFKVSRKTFFAPATWLGYDDVKGNTLTTWNALKSVFVVPTAKNPETFSEAKARLHLTEADLKEIEINYFFYALLFLGCALITGAGAIIFLVKYASFKAFLVALATSGIFLSQAFRNHFLYFQVKARKLGCTYQEWQHFIFNGLGAGK